MFCIGSFSWTVYSKEIETCMKRCSDSLIMVDAKMSTISLLISTPFGSTLPTMTLSLAV